MVGRTSNGTNLIDQDLTSEENLLNKFLFDFESFDLSTICLTGQEMNLSSTSTNGNSSEKIEYLMKQEDAKYILKWHFGVKLFRSWIENKNIPIRQKFSQRNEKNRK